MLRKVFAAISAAFAVAACTPEVQLNLSQPFSPEWCQGAKAYGRQQFYNLALCHERNVAGFPADENVIVYYLREAARWGSVDAGAALARRGMPVPDDDLRRESDARRANERNTRIIANALRPAPPSQQTVARPAVVVVPGPGATIRRENRTESVRRNCVNNVCKVERTVCIDGRCTTTVSDR